MAQVLNNRVCLFGEKVKESSFFRRALPVIHKLVITSQEMPAVRMTKLSGLELKFSCVFIIAFPRSGCWTTCCQVTACVYHCVDDSVVSPKPSYLRLAPGLRLLNPGSPNSHRRSTRRQLNYLREPSQSVRSSLGENTQIRPTFRTAWTQCEERFLHSWDHLEGKPHARRIARRPGATEYFLFRCETGWRKLAAIAIAVTRDEQAENTSHGRNALGTA